MIDWTKDRIERMKKMWHLGYSASQIASAIGVESRSAVIGKLYRLGLSRRSQDAGSRRAMSDGAKQRHREEAARKKTAAPKKRPLVADGLPLPTAQDYDVARKNLLRLEPNDCKWPVGEAEPVQGFCALERLPGFSYCTIHVHRAYRPPEVRTNRKPTASISHEVAQHDLEPVEVG